MATKKARKEKGQVKFDRETLVDMIWCDLLNGESRYHIQLKLKNDQYEGFKTSRLCRTTLYNYIEEAYNNCKIELEERREGQKQLAYERLRDVYMEAKSNRQYKDALKALDMMNRMTGVYEPEKVDVTGNMKVNITFGINNEDEEG